MKPPAERIQICGQWIDNVTMREAVERIHEMVRSRKPSYVVTPNVDHIVRLQWDTDMQRAYQSASLVLADGMPVVWAGAFLGTPFKAKVSGSDLFWVHCPEAVKYGHRLFFMGGKPGAIEKSKEVLEKRFPGIQIVGLSCPPIGFEKDPEENSKLIEQIKQASPDVLYVGLGAPKQERWMADHHQELNVPVCIGVGGTFEFVSGFVRRAPVFMQKWSMEWVWRLMMDPKRLWRRYLVDDPEFFWLLLQQRFGKGEK